MASSSSLARTWTYRVFTSFHGPDVRKTFLSHLRKQFSYNGISMFDDQGIDRSQTIAPAITRAISESRISIVLLSENYASSSWCLDELVEILKCREDIGQIVMTVFYGVDPSDVADQTGEFGIGFNNMCAEKTKEEKTRWSQALNDAANIAGEDFQNWYYNYFSHDYKYLKETTKISFSFIVRDNEAKMIEKIARDISNKLNVTPCNDFEGMVGLEAHLREIESLLDLDYDGVKMVAITGPAGIGKTTIARAMQSLFSHRFQLACLVDNLRGNYHSGFDEYGLKLGLQQQFLSKILNQDGIRIYHLGAIQERLHDQRVLIILDDVNNIKQLEALANEPTWFGPGSRIVITTENKELLQQHGINNTYHVGFPSREEALEILCKYAFRQSHPHNGFKELGNRVTELCDSLPLGLRVVGSSLCGKEEDEWNEAVRRLETILDHRDIEEVLKVGYESLHENEQILFLHIAIFFNYKNVDHVRNMLTESDLDVKHELKTLVNRSLIQIFTSGGIVMHKLLQQVGRQAINRQEPWKRRILIDAQEICDVLEHNKGTRAVSGMSFDISDIDEVSINERAFKRMPNLRFLRVYKRRYDGNDRMHIPEDMEFPRRLRLLDWQAYPSKSLPSKFGPEYLVEFSMQHSNLEKLWEGTQPLKNLKKMDLLGSTNLKELPDLSKATNLDELDLNYCESLVEIPSSFSHLQKLTVLWMEKCRNLQVIPPHINLASLEYVFMEGCSRLMNFSFISKNLRAADISESSFDDVPPSIKLCSRLRTLHIKKNGKLKGLTHLPMSLTKLDLSFCDIERIPDCMKALQQLYELNLTGCRRLTSLPELPHSLEYLYADDCEALETVFLPLNHTPYAKFSFANCFKLSQQSRRDIVRQSFRYGWVLLPGRQVPAEFDHRARGNSLTIRPDGNVPFSASSTLKFCVVVSPNHAIKSLQLLCRHKGSGDSNTVINIDVITSDCRTEHLSIFSIKFPELSSEIVFEFISTTHDFDIVECGVSAYEDQVSTDNDDEDDTDV